MQEFGTHTKRLRKQCIDTRIIERSPARELTHSITNVHILYNTEETHSKHYCNFDTPISVVMANIIGRTCTLEYKELILGIGLAAAILISACQMGLLMIIMCYRFKRAKIYSKEQEERFESKRSMAELLISGRQGEYDESERLKFRRPKSEIHSSFRQVHANSAYLLEESTAFENKVLREEIVMEEVVLREESKEVEFKSLMDDKDLASHWVEFEKNFGTINTEVTPIDRLDQPKAESETKSEKVNKLTDLYGKLTKIQKEEVKAKMMKYIKARPTLDPYDSEYKALVSDINKKLGEITSRTSDRQQSGGLMFANLFLTQEDIDRQKRALDMYIERSQDSTVSKRKYSDTKNAYLKTQALLESFEDETSTQTTTLTEFNLNI